MSFKVPEQYRDLIYSTKDDGNNGVFYIPAKQSRNDLKIIASDGMGWNHVSVSKKYECPSWEEMCMVKNLFWGEDVWVQQFHPSKSEYVNNHPYCLHLWEPVDGINKIPSSILVGIKI